MGWMRLTKELENEHIKIFKNKSNEIIFLSRARTSEIVEAEKMTRQIKS